MTTPSVEMHPAYRWDCDACGRENFCRAIVPEMSAEDMAELMADHGVQPWETGEFRTYPDRVTCAHCGAAFDCKNPGEDDE